MNTSITKYCLAILILSVAITFLISCRSTSKVVFQTNVIGTKMRYLISDNPNYKHGEGKFYVCVGSGNNRVYYSFQPNYIYKTYNNVRNYVYTLVFDRQPMVKLTSIDFMIFTKADNLLDSLGYNDLKRSKNAKGFIVEVAGH